VYIDIHIYIYTQATRTHTYEHIHTHTHMYTADPPLLIARVKDAHHNPSGVCCSVLQCGAAWCGVLQCVAAYHDPSGEQGMEYRVISKQNFYLCMVFFIILFMGRWVGDLETHISPRSLSPTRHLSMTMSRTFLLSM